MYKEINLNVSADFADSWTQNLWKYIEICLSRSRWNWRYIRTAYYYIIIIIIIIFLLYYYYIIIILLLLLLLASDQRYNILFHKIAILK